jgi:hypothetical protein
MRHLLLISWLLAAQALGVTAISVSKDDNVAGLTDDVTQSGIVATGKTVKILRFGGVDPKIADALDSVVLLQWGSGATWKTIRAGTDTFDFEVNQDFVGDGTKRVRVVRANRSALSKQIIFWIEGLILD